MATSANRVEIEVGHQVSVSGAESKLSPGCTLPGFRGVVIAIEGDQIDVSEFKSHSRRSVTADRVRVVRRSVAYDKHVEEIGDLPRPKAWGRDIIDSDTECATIRDAIQDGHIAYLNQKAQRGHRKEDTMAAKTSKKSAKTKAPKVAADPKTAPRKSRSKVDLTGVSPEDFFHENAKGKSVFRPGHDARFAGILKRVAAGTGTSDDKRLAASKTLLNHPKVAESEHFQALIAQI